MDLLKIFFEKSKVSIDNKLKPFNNTTQLFKTLESYYNASRDKDLELELRLKESSDTSKNSSNLTPETFVKTLTSLYKDRPKDLEKSDGLYKPTIINYILQRKDVYDNDRGNKRVSKTLRKITNIELVDEAGEYKIKPKNFVTEQKISKFTITPTQEHLSNIVEKYGYSIKLAISEEKDMSESNITGWEKAFTCVRFSFYLSEDWRVDCTIKHEHKLLEFENMLKEMVEFLKQFSKYETIDDFINSFANKLLPNVEKADFFDIELEYLLKSDEGNRDVIKDITNMIKFLITHGIKKKESTNMLSSGEQYETKVELWKHLRPLWSDYDKKRSDLFDNMINENSLTFQAPLSNCRTMLLKELAEVYTNLEKYKYFISRKLDGERCLLILDPIPQTSEMYVAIFKADSKVSMTVNNIENINKKIIIEAEMFENVIYAYDLLQYGTSYFRKPTDARFSMLATIKNIGSYVAKLGNYGYAVKEAKILDYTNFTDEMENTFVEEDSEGKRFDGIILTPVSEEYIISRNNFYKVKPYKANTIDMLAEKIDKIVLKQLYFINTDKIHSAYVLYTTRNKIFENNCIVYDIKNNPYFAEHFADRKFMKRYPVIFSTPYNALTQFLLITNEDYAEYTKNGLFGKESDFDNKVIECYWHRPKNATINDTLEKGRWKALRVRIDKTYEYNAGIEAFGNFYEQSLSIFATAINPIEEKHIKNPDSLKQFYYQEIPKPIQQRYIHQRMISNIAKALLYEDVVSVALTADDSALEISGGRGGDFRRLYFSGARKVFVSDADIDAVIEYIQRYIEAYTKNSLSKFAEGTLTNLRSGKIQHIDKLQVNLKCFKYTFGEDDIRRFIENLKSDKEFPNYLINVASMHFAIHYLCGNTKDIGDLSNLLNEVIRKNGKFATTFYDGYAILDLFNRVDGDMIRKENENTISIWDTKNKIKKYHIELLFDRKKIQPNFGLKIKIWLPTISMDLREEYLVFIDKLEEALQNFSISKNKNSDTKNFGGILDIKDIEPIFCKLNKDQNISKFKDIVNPEDLLWCSMAKYAIFTKIK